jgi:hypothetical protein
VPRRMSVVRGIGIVVAAAFVLSLPAAAADGFDPASTSVTVVPGGSQTIEQTLHLDALPQKADIVIAIDTTGSMQPAIDDARNDATAIVGGVTDSIPGARFAVVEFKDYPFDPYGLESDFPYELRQPFTADAAEVEAAFTPMTAFGGNDLPEAHNRVFFETYADPALAWDPQAARILIVLTDAIPHDTVQMTTFTDCPNTDVTDPGDTSAETGELHTKSVIDGLVANNTTLSVITYPTEGSDAAAPACMKALAEATGGRQVERGETDSLLALIQDLVTDQAKKIDRIAFRDDAPEGWSVSFAPSTPYGPFTAPVDVPFEETITVPEDAALGTYTITVTEVVNGAERATHQVTVEVEEIAGLQVKIDRRSVKAGIASFSPSVVPAARIPFFGGASIASAPVGSIPVGSVPVGSIPVGSIPVGSVPVGSIPV